MADSRTMSEMEALDKYLELRGIAPERKALLTRYARELLSVLESRPD
jgi:hypothetical protein